MFSLRRRVLARTFFHMNDESENSTPATAPSTSPAAEDQPTGLRGVLQRYWPLIRHWALFMTILGLLVAVSEWGSYWTNHRFSEITAGWFAYSMRLMGETPVVHGVKFSCAICNFTIIGECTAYYPCAIFVSAVLAFQASWSRKLLGVALGVPILLLINQVRLVTLCYVARPFPEYFETIHLVVWQSLFIFITIMLWILWVVTLADRR